MILLAFLCTRELSAQQKDSVFTKATLTNATVYYGYGAELQHSSKAMLVNGMQQVVVNNIALQPDINTLQIACPENVTILSFYHRVYTKPAIVIENPLSVKSKDTLKLLQKKLAAISNTININEDVLRRITALIETNFTSRDKKEISSAELIKLTTYYTGQVVSLKESLFVLQEKRNEVNEQIAAVSNRHMQSSSQAETTEEEKPTGQLIMQVMSRGAGSVNFDLSYFTRNAGWVPTYDIRVKTIDNSFKLVYKALVSQTTGLNWSGVKLNLSTSNPNQGTTLPHLLPLYLQLYVPVIYDNIQSKSMADNSNIGQLNSVEIIAGYNQKKPNELTNSVSSVSDFMVLKESQLNTNFEIDLPYDIPSDGNAYSVIIKDQKIPATYQHFAIPKLEKDAFLLARLSRWDSLSLLPGVANIIMDNVYLGKSTLDPNSTSDTLNISLGRDKRIAINRKLVKEFKTTAKSDQKVEIFTYEIIVKNNKKQPLTLLLKDQFPISKTKEVEVTLTNSGNAETNMEKGILSWEVQLQPGESKKYRFSYQVKYPKDKILQEGR